MIYFSKTTDTTFCMDFNPEGTRYPQELVNASFRRERDYLLRLSKYSWAPELLEINPSKRHIIFKWNGTACDTILPPNWKEQLEQIIKDLHSEQIYKVSIYPKFFFADKDGKMKAFNFYTAFDYSEQPVEVDFYRPIFNPDRAELIDSLSIDGKIDLRLLNYYAFNSYVKWPDDPLPEIYKRVYK